ncbi:NAD(P)-dependent oxidoreductase [Sphaerisporangium melleum]|uniref:NAD(P)-dependent oxidoreductase n=1 Tax=Sphaerisporangium melleum TaxID=321316 RepID=A0A917RH22_9ACTN|nr:SDR family oxidoreductase [Sphaerisporangium melleum]GGL07059.1 NAD(P)-dependent oxidoreductase [Sphaerisporangium melleum]GII68734.1 NAD(P)-dependent oxidoreductase [Sphaerisporangium melleum]
MVRCLVTGATGYIGGRLAPELLAAGHEVRCMARSARGLRGHGWYDRVEVAEADATDPVATRAALEGVQVAFYLIHTMAAGRDFAERDRVAARTFAAAAKDAGVRRIVYLGGLPPPERPSPHMRSRAEVEEILLSSGVPTIAFRASVIIGSGSVSFEMLRHLTERLPVMTTPRWVRTRTQPIAIRDVLRYLAAAPGIPEGVNRSFDIGGPDVLTYAQMMQGYAAVAGLPPRLVIPVPLLTPRLSSLWVGLVTPVPSGVARPLVESLRGEAVCREHDIARYIPDPPEGLTPFPRAVRLALLRIKEADVVTRWSSASTPGTPSEPLPTDPGWAGGSLYVDERETVVNAPPAALWRIIEGIGGAHGWYSLPLAWWFRGALDRAFGGVGLRRGRRDPARLRVGDALDFWRVEEIEPGRLLRLRAEMRLPGLAWLELRCRRREDGGTVYGQRAIFHPRGLFGHVYWWAVYPLHGLIFGRMPGNVARAAAALARSGTENFSEASDVVPAQPVRRSRVR